MEQINLNEFKQDVNYEVPVHRSNDVITEWTKCKISGTLTIVEQLKIKQAVDLLQKVGFQSVVLAHSAEVLNTESSLSWSEIIIYSYGIQFRIVGKHDEDLFYESDIIPLNYEETKSR